MEVIKEIELEADNKKEALEKAHSIFKEELSEEVIKDNIIVELVEEKKKLFGILGSSKTFRVSLERKKKRVDGTFKVSIREDGIFLKVIQPEGKGREVKMDMVEEVLEIKEIEEVDYGAVSEALVEDNKELKIAERNHELDRDAELEVTIGRDKMEAYLNYTPPLGGNAFSVNEIIKKLKEEGVIFGIREDDLKEIFNPDEKLEDFLVASAKDPIEGENGYIKFEVDFEQKDKKVSHLEDGSVDYKNLGRIINVKEGDLLATKVGAVEGEAGTNVLGQEVPPGAVEDVELPLGDNVSLSEDKTSIIADMEGQVVNTKNLISILDVHTVSGNVDLSTGNIDFKGNVIVNGNITEGMEVKAKGNVEVSGSVYGADIEAGGQIIVAKGFIGLNKAKLKAEGNIQVKFIENGTISTEEDIIILDAAMHSHLDAGQKVIVTERKGLVVGGEVRAGKEIDARIIGSNLATPTELFVGITPELRDNFENIDNEFKEKQEGLDMTIKNIAALKKKRANSKDGLNNKKQQLLNQLTRQRFQVANKLEEIKKERKKISKKIEEGKKGRIKVQEALFPGVIFTIGKCVKRIEKPESHVQYYVEDATIKSVSYS